MSILHIVHKTTFTYGAAIPSSYNEARLTPAFLPHQRLLDSRIDISPFTWRGSFRDYWDTQVVAFEVLQPHESLEVTAYSTVELTTPVVRTHLPTWDEITGPVLKDLLAEYLVNTSTTHPPEDLAAFAHDAARKGQPMDSARAICDYLHDEVNYVPGATSVHSPGAQAWAARSGVCQDFAHLATGALRSVGIPARYVSGYLHPTSDAPIGAAVPGESHAWIEYWSGDWYGYDPTNGRAVGDDHVVVARAREYRDVPPLTGVFAGTGESLEVKVTITRKA